MNEVKSEKADYGGWFNLYVVYIADGDERAAEQKMYFVVLGRAKKKRQTARGSEMLIFSTSRRTKRHGAVIVIQLERCGEPDRCMQSHSKQV